MSLFVNATENVHGHRDVTPQQVQQALGAVRLVDVREPHEYNAELGHVPGAELVPLATVAQAASGWDRDAELVLICRSGGRSGRAATELTRLGFRRVMNMVGGMLAYNAAGLEVERR